MPSKEWKDISVGIRAKILLIRDVASANFLKREAPLLSGKIAETFYTTGGRGVKVRSGHARRGWTEFYPAPNQAVVANTVPYADFTKERVIVPKKGKMLAIPIGKALTNAGVARFTGPRDPALPKLSLIARPGKAPLLVDTAGKKKFDVYFALVPKVRIPAYTGDLPAFIRQEKSAIAERFLPYIKKAFES